MVEGDDDAPFVEEGEEAAVVVGEGAAIEVEADAKEEESYGRSDDPVRHVPARDGQCELLSREGEIEIAKRIESGREMVISSLCESPTVMHIVLDWARQAVRRRDAAARGHRPRRDLRRGHRGQVRRRQREQGDSVAPDEEEEADEYDALEGGRKEVVEDYDDEEAVLSLVAMEQELLPQVLEKFDAFAKISKAVRKLQEKKQSQAMGEGEVTAADDKKYPKLLAEMVEVMLSIRFNNMKVEELMHTLYAINKRLITTEMQLLKLAEKHHVKRASFLQSYNGHELDPKWLKNVAKLKEKGWKEFTEKEAKPAAALREEIQRSPTRPGSTSPSSSAWSRP